MFVTRCAVWTAVLIAVAGCCKSEEREEVIPIPEPARTPQPVQPPEATLALPTPTVAPTPAAVTPAALGPDGLPVDIPPPGSKAPTLAEWNAVPKEITVARSTPLGCETKMVREWLRVSCRGKNNTGGETVSVKSLTRGTGAMEYQAKGVTSVVVPVMRGKRYEALYTWTDKRQTLVVDWQNAGGRPSIKFQD